MRWPTRLFLLVASLMLTTGAVVAQTISVRPVIGGFPADSGFSLGAEVSRKRLVGPIDGRLQAVASVKKYYRLEAGFEVPHLGPWFYLGVTSRYRNHPEEDFWGLGPNTPKEARTNYLLEDIDTTAVLGTASNSGRVRAGVTGGFLRGNTGPGRDNQFPSVPDSLQSQPRYAHFGLYFENKSLDSESDPRSGGHYQFQADTFGSRFQRYTVDLRRFISMTPNDRIGLRLQTLFTHQSSPEEIPFFMLPTAGGNDTVRGFNQYRFRDRNALLLNAEYRRPGFRFLDAVAFVDAGRVFSHPGNLGLTDLHTSAGLGTRIKLGGRVLFGVDVGFSREGTHLWFRSGHTF